MCPTADGERSGGTALHEGHGSVDTPRRAVRTRPADFQGGHLQIHLPHQQVRAPFLTEADFRFKLFGFKAKMSRHCLDYTCDHLSKPIMNHVFTFLGVCDAFIFKKLSPGKLSAQRILSIKTGCQRLQGNWHVCIMTFLCRSRCGDRDEPSPKRIKTEVRSDFCQFASWFQHLSNIFGLYWDVSISFKLSRDCPNSGLFLQAKKASQTLHGVH